VPSAEVLDELLRAFSVDVTDQQGMDRVDLGSPEVEELLTPPADASPVAPDVPTVVPPVVDPEPRPRPEVEGSAEGDDEEVGPAPDEATAGIEPTDGSVPVTEAPASTSQVEAEAEEEVPLERAVDTETVAEGTTDSGAEVEAVVGQEPEPPAAQADAPTVAVAPKTIVIDSADDPPDAVYLAAGDPLLMRPARSDVAPAAEAPSDAPIFIDDRPTGETISIEAATSATRIEPRMRDRRIAVRRAAGMKRLRWVLLAAVVIIVVVAVLAVLGSGLFAIDDVEVEGAVYTNPDALAAVVAGLEGSPVLRADTDRAERDLEAIPWVEDARVTTDFPHGAKIEIRERKPAATYEGQDGRFRVIDTHGRVLDVLDAQPVEYPVVLSADSPDLEPGQFAPPGFGAAASLLSALTPELRATTQSVAVTPDGSDLRLMLGDGLEVRFGAARDLVVKLVRLQTRLDELEGGGFSYVDVSTDEVTTG
jgi:cell division protein FtsQ